MALEDGAGLDFAALRTTRRDRVFAAMDEHGLDVLMLNRGRERALHARAPADLAVGGDPVGADVHGRTVDAPDPSDGRDVG